MRSFLPIFTRGALDVALHELRESVDGSVSALSRHLQIREPCVAEQIHGAQQSPVLQQVIERLAGEELHRTTQCPSSHPHRLRQRLARDAGGAGEVGGEVLEDGVGDGGGNALKIKLWDGDNWIHVACACVNDRE